MRIEYKGRCMKKLGIIGGVSWESTAVYYKLINEKVKDRLGRLHSAPLILFSMDYQELVDYKNQGQWDKIAAKLSDTARGIEQAGADAVILCCNTLHKVAEEIEQAIHIPFLHITDAAGDCLRLSNIQKIGLLGTQFTLEDGFYQTRLMEKFQIEVILPEKDDRMTLDSIIYNELCAGVFSDESNKILIKMMDSLVASGAQGILLGCTELGMLIQPKSYAVPIFDTTVLHADLATSWVIA